MDAAGFARPSLLLVRLKGEDPVLRGSQSQASKELRSFIASYRVGDPVPTDMRKRLARVVNWAIAGPSLVKVAAAAKIRLRPGTAKLAKQAEPSEDELLKLNRLLLEDAFPGALKPLR